MQISTEEDKTAALAKLASLRQVEPGTAEEETMMQIVSALAGYVADRDADRGLES
jgi:hypothetical protein